MRLGTAARSRGVCWTVEPTAQSPRRVDLENLAIAVTQTKGLPGALGVIGR